MCMSHSPHRQVAIACAVDSICRPHPTVECHIGQCTCHRFQIIRCVNHFCLCGILSMSVDHSMVGCAALAVPDQLPTSPCCVLFYPSHPPHTRHTSHLTPHTSHLTSTIPHTSIAQAMYIGIESVVWHLLRLCAYPTNELEMKILAAEAIPPPPSSDAKLEEWVKWESEWWESQAHCLRVPRISLTAADKRGFIDAWKKSH